MTHTKEIQTSNALRNNTQKFLLEMGFELLEIWNLDSGVEYEIWENKITKSRTKVNIVEKENFQDASRQEVVNEIIDLWYELRAIREMFDDEQYHFTNSNGETAYDRYKKLVEYLVGEEEGDEKAWRFIYNTVIDPETLAYLELDKEDKIAMTQ